MSKKQKTHSAERRLDQALYHAGLSRGQLARKAGLPGLFGGTASSLANNAALWWQIPSYVVSFAAICLVDARWLATGDESKAATAAKDSIKRALKETTSLTLEDREKILTWAALTEEPEHGVGICRYCGCTDECGCGECRWVDRAATICSACLLPEV